MKNTIIDTYKYFSRFVPAAVLEKSFTQSPNTQEPGYSEIAVEVQQPSNIRIPEIDSFVVSINENFISEKLTNSKGFVLFVEYGKISYNPDESRGISEHLAITVSRNISGNNTDNLNEVLIMNKCLEILMSIINKMKEEQYDIDFCSIEKLITFPLELSVVEPENFYGLGGWVAIFKNEKTALE